MPRALARFILPITLLCSVSLWLQVSPAEDTQSTAREKMPASLLRLLDKADYVCRGRITNISSRREKYDAELELVMSHIKWDVLEDLKNSCPTEFRSFGGTIDNISYYAIEFPKFQVGKEVLLLLGNFKGGVFPVGHSRGKWDLPPESSAKNRLLERVKGHIAGRGGK